MDPSIRKPYDILKYMYFLWIGQILNNIAVGVLKYSICAYLLALKFSRVYLIVVWASVLMVTIFNMILPVMGCFCSTPLEANWNKTVKGKCFMKGGAGLTYSQGIANIITNVIYVVAPMIYLSSVQLPRRTQWGLRIVFCLVLAVMVCSVAKTIELSTLMKTSDPMWDGTNLSIWSSSELSVGVLVASSPPLRKQFDTFFRRMLSSMGTKSKTQASGNEIPLYNANKQFTIGSGPKGDRSRFQRDDIDDGDSKKYILDNSAQPGKGEITRTIVHEVRNDDRKSVQVPDRIGNMYG
ncbi:hypothetical protein G6011_09204 [Alternaria panax]|uniref:Rhodopsin domain-containing protein n=1 Tax=Alternaria panax TaxID=48097 RepID=A0AAD4IAP4_9PLEO|nr:hypothetical protein G6011_09204 [Alternaria panax]